MNASNNHPRTLPVACIDIEGDKMDIYNDFSKLDTNDCAVNSNNFHDDMDLDDNDEIETEIMFQGKYIKL